jgi:hypothetical protein
MVGHNLLPISGFNFAEMLNISHRQTIAYHPESNGAVKRLHPLKDTLRTHAAAATWSEELPFVLLGLRAQPREDPGLSLAEPVFGAPIVLPDDFLQTEEFSIDSFIKNFSKTLDAPASSLPRHNSSVQPSSSPPPSSGSVVAAWSHLSNHSTKAPTPFCPMALAPSPSKLGHGTRSSPSAASSPVRLRMLSLAARVATADCWVCAQVALPQPSRSCFQARWYLHLPLRRCLETVPEPFSYLARRFLHAQDWRRHHRFHRSGTRPVNGHRHRG